MSKPIDLVQSTLDLLSSRPRCPGRSPTAIFGLLLVSAFVLVIAGLEVRRTEIDYGAE